MSSIPWKRLLFLFLFLPLIIPQACSKQDLKSQDDDLIRIREVYSMVKKIREEYEEKDLQALTRTMEPETEDLSNNLRTWLEKDFEEYSKIHLGFRVDEIIMDKDLFTVRLHWEGEWEKRSDKERVRETGNASLRIKGEKKMRLSAIDGDNPFGISLLKEGTSKGGG